MIVERVRVDSRTPVVVVAGWAEGARRLGSGLLAAGTVLVRHDLALLREGAVTRTVTTAETEQVSVLELAHGCVSCTLRGDLLPLLRVLSDRSSVSRIVLLLDPAIEPLEVCEAIDDIPVTGIVGRVDAPAARDVRVAAVVTAVDAAGWLADMTGDETMADRLGIGDEDRTVAQVAVAQVEFADALVFFGTPDPIDAAELIAVSARLAPTASVHWNADALDIGTVVAAVPAEPRIARGFDPHGPLLAGMPPLDMDAGVGLIEFAADRPFHPERLHQAIDVLLDGVVTARGRVWSAGAADQVLWLESAGAGLRIGPVGAWLAAMSPAEQKACEPQRLAMAASRWDPRYGDRHTSLVLLVRGADPGEIDRTLRWALVTDDEFRRPESWSSWPDPFGEWHEDPCNTTESGRGRTAAEGERPS